MLIPDGYDEGVWEGLTRRAGLAVAGKDREPGGYGAALRRVGAGRDQRGADEWAEDEQQRARRL